MLLYAPTRIRSPSAKLTTPAGWLLAYRLNLALIRETSTRPTATAGCLSTSPRARAYDETGKDDKRKYTVAQIAAEFGVSPDDLRVLRRSAEC